MFLLDFFKGVIDLFEHIGDHHVHPMIRQGFRGTPSQSSGGAGYHGHLSHNIPKHSSPILSHSFSSRPGLLNPPDVSQINSLGASVISC